MSEKHIIELDVVDDKATMVNGYQYSRNVSTIPEEDEEADESRNIEVEVEHTNDGSVKEVPSQKWDFTLNNIIQQKCLGENYILAGMAENKSSVFKIKLIEWRTIVTDYLGLDSLYDTSKVGNPCELISDFNTRMLRGYTPICRQKSGDTLDKEFVYIIRKFFQETLKDISIRALSEIVQVEFEKMHRCSKTEPDSFDLKNAIKKAVVQVALTAFLGESFHEKSPDYDLIFDWRENVTRDGLIDSIFSLVMIIKEKNITNNLFSMINNMQKIKEARILYTDVDFEKLLNEIVYSIIWVAIGDLSNMIVVCAREYLKLSSKHKRDLMSESQFFFEASNDALNDLLPELSTMHSFYMEMVRLFPLEPIFLRRAKKDFVLESTSGSFLIKKGNLLCGYPHIARRDPNIFEKPNRVILNRCLENSRYDFAYGGLYPDNLMREAYGEIFSVTCEKIIKVFILFLTKCTMIPVESLPKIDHYFENQKNSDNILIVKDFYYER